MAVPRSHGFHERRQSSRVIQLRPRTGMICIWPCRSRDATYSASPTANTPTATMHHVDAVAEQPQPEREALLPGQAVGADQPEQQPDAQRGQSARHRASPAAPTR